MQQTGNRHDPRLYQITVLSLLVVVGVTLLDIGIRWQHAVAIFIAAQFTQYIGSHLTSPAAFDPRSAMITTLSLTLLLRIDSVLLATVAGVVAIGSKFLLRVNGKHVFNPSSIAIVSLVLLCDGAWLSSGQWGSTVLVTCALACGGTLVLSHARRAETTLSFLGTFVLLLFGRALWLGDPLAIPLHHLQNGTLLIFSFFMISDPKTTPDAAWGRVLYGALVATIAWMIQFVFYCPNGPVLALPLAAPLVPLVDAIGNGQRYRWTPNDIFVPVCKSGGPQPCEFPLLLPQRQPPFLPASTRRHSADSMLPVPTPACTTRLPRSYSSATTIAPSLRWPTTSRATRKISPS